MASDVEAIARVQLTKVMDTDTAPEDIDPDTDMEEYGLTSLEKILFITATCESTGVDLSLFTDRDVDAMHTLRDVTKAVGAHANEVT
ncbi:MAG: acyl carrier protein [Streptosporangiaceae bacterium]|jgi:acyl carrier protein